jgi:uncharacterized membrane-anchored protein
MRKRLAIASGLLILLIINFFIYKMELLRTNGEILLLKFHYEDQKDYINLKFKIEEDCDRYTDYNCIDGYFVLKRDKNNVGEFVRFEYSNESLQSEKIPLQPGEIYLRYRVHRFPECSDKTENYVYFFHLIPKDASFSDAHYGEFRIARDGTALLTGLRDKDFNALATTQY